MAPPKNAKATDTAPTIDPVIAEARAKLFGKFGGSQMGGKGTARRKVRATNKQVISDEKRLQVAFRKLQMTNIGNVDEVAIVNNDSSALVFSQPSVQVLANANLYVIRGTPKQETDYESNISNVNQLTPELLQQFAAQIKKLQEAQKSQTNGDVNADDDEQIPELIGTFDSLPQDGAAAPN